MENLYHIYQIDSFTKERLTGNPAGVVTNADGLSDQQMQKIARELNNSETAFIFKPENDTYDMQVRFFARKSDYGTKLDRRLFLHPKDENFLCQRKRNILCQQQDFRK